MKTGEPVHWLYIKANVVDINSESELTKQENPFLPLEWE